MNRRSESEDKTRLTELEGMRPPHVEAYFRVMGFLRPGIARVLDTVRHSREKVYIAPPFSRGGNWLYLLAAVDADRRADAGDFSYMLDTAGLEPWLTEFPALQELMMDPKDFKFLHRRYSGLDTNVEDSFAPGSLEIFARERLLSSEHFKQRILTVGNIVGNNTVVLSIRRGDYYSVPAIRQRYGIDTVAYVREALDQVLKRMSPSNFVVTSDDPQWCRENLSFLEDIAPVLYDKTGEGMFADLAVLAKARWLILTNTTFGYWGAYMAQADHPAEVYVPNAHEYDAKTRQPIVVPGTVRPHPHFSRWHAVKPPHGGTWLLPEEGDTA